MEPGNGITYGAAIRAEARHRPSGHDGGTHAAPAANDACATDRDGSAGGFRAPKRTWPPGEASITKTDADRDSSAARGGGRGRAGRGEGEGHSTPYRAAIGALCRSGRASGECDGRSCGEPDRRGSHADRVGPSCPRDGGSTRVEREGGPSLDLASYGAAIGWAPPGIEQQRSRLSHAISAVMHSVELRRNLSWLGQGRRMRECERGSL